MKSIKTALFFGASALLLTACMDNQNQTDDFEPTEEVGDGETSVDEGTTEPGTTHGTLQDGTYELEEMNPDENGWRVMFTIEVEGGEVVSSDYNEYNEEGTAKTEDDDYQQMMADETGVGPQDYVPELNNQLVEQSDPAQIDAVSGATSSSTKFQEYAAMLLNAAENGATEGIEVDN